MRLLKLVTAAALAATLAGGASAQTVGLATNPQGSLYYAIGAAVAKMMNDKVGLRARVQPYAGSSTYIPLLNRNEVEFALINVKDAVISREGTEDFDGRPQPNVRLLNVMFPILFAFVVPADSPVKQVSDVKGMLLASGYHAQTTVRTLQEAILANGGLTPADVRSYPVPNSFDGVDALGDGRIDVGPGALGIAQVQRADIKLRSRGGVRFVSISTAPDALARMQAVMPSRPILVEPSDATPGVVEPTHFMGFLAFLATNDQLTDEVAYNVVKMLHENKPALVEATRALSRFDPKGMAFPMEAPYHPGAIKFYREVGQWPPK